MIERRVLHASKQEWTLGLVSLRMNQTCPILSVTPPKSVTEIGHVWLNIFRLESSKEKL
jgi:hypothetical protein